MQSMTLRSLYELITIVRFVDMFMIYLHAKLLSLFMKLIFTIYCFGSSMILSLCLFIMRNYFDLYV